MATLCQILRSGVSQGSNSLKQFLTLARNRIYPTARAQGARSPTISSSYRKPTSTLGNVITLIITIFLLGLLAAPISSEITPENHLSALQTSSKVNPATLMAVPSQSKNNQSPVQATVAEPAGESPSIFGVWLGDDEYASRVDALKQTGAKWTRTMVVWSQIEPNYTQPATYDFERYDRLFGALSQADIAVIAEIRGNPDWAASTACGPIDRQGGIESFSRFLRALALRYSQSPYSVKHWELYNEPDNTNMGEAASYLGGCWGDFPDEYVAMLKIAYETIRQADPDAKIVLGGLAHESSAEVFNFAFLERILAAGVGAYIDIMNIHYYSSYGPAWSAYGRDIIGKTTAVRQTMLRYGVSKPVAVTESSWTSSPKDSPDLLEKQAQYIPKLLARSRSLNLHSVQWFLLNDWWGSDYPYGLTFDTMQAKPSYNAFKLAAAEFGQASSVRELSPGEVGATSTAIEGYAFQVAGQERWLLWSESGTIQINIPARAIASTDKYGNPIPLNAGVTGTAIQLGGDPIYVHLTPLPPRVWLPLVSVTAAE